MQNFDYMRLDGHTFRVFVSVCETGSLSKTALLFEVNQSTISHTVDKMRAALNDPLFIKSGRGITPTDKALRILPRVQAILADIEGLVAPEDYDAVWDTRPVTVAIPSPALLQPMRELRTALHKIAPSLRLEVKRLAPREQTESILADEQAEVAVAVSGVKFSSILNTCPFYEEDLVIFYDGTQRGPIDSIEEYASAPHGVINFGGSQKSEVAKALNALGIERRIAIVAPTASMLGSLLIGTDIITTMPQSLAASVYGPLDHCPMPFDIPPIRYELVWHRRFENSGRNQWLRRLLLDTAQSRAE